MSEYLALPDGAGSFSQDFSGPVILRRPAGIRCLTPTGLSPSVVLLSSQLRFQRWIPYMRVLQPRRSRNCDGLGFFPFARHYLGNHYIVLFSSGYLDVSVHRVCFTAPIYSERNDRSSTCRVAPFGHPRIIAWLQLPAAYRSLSRPSSPAHA